MQLTVTRQFEIGVQDFIETVKQIFIPDEKD